MRVTMKRGKANRKPYGVDLESTERVSLGPN